VFCFLSAYFLLMLPFGFISSVYRAHGEFVISVMINNLMRLGLIACIAATLAFGVSADALALTYAAIALVTWLGIIFHQRRRHPDLRYGIAVPDKQAFRTMLSIGPAYAVSARRHGTDNSWHCSAHFSAGVVWGNNWRL
jgi:O-antigen/teichoic acid export membrane protein